MQPVDLRALIHRWHRGQEQIELKRLEWRDRFQNTAHEVFLKFQGQDAIALIQLIEFKRIISNLINNALEAIPQQGSVTVSVESLPTAVVVSVTDDGPGIPEDLLVSLGTEGVTAGKAQGSGLGLFHAKHTVNYWGGTLDIKSSASTGTRVTISLPKNI